MRIKPTVIVDILNYSAWKPSLLRFSRDRVSVLALLGLVVIALLSVDAAWIAQNILHTDPFEQSLLHILEPWFTPRHLMGTDELGRDVLTRILFAGRVSLAIGFSVALLQSTLGISLGLLAGYYGGWLDDLINALLQIVRGVPAFFLLISLSALMPHTLFSLVVVLSLLGWTGTCRQVRGLVLSIRQSAYVEAALSLGASNGFVLLRHLLPNISSIALVIASFDIAGAIITESSLSFLGFGVQPPTPSWGNMLKSALNNISIAPWLIVIPGICISVTVLCVFLVADGLRDALDPHLSGRGISRQ